MNLRRSIKAELDEVISLSDEQLVPQLQAYWLKTELDETRLLVEACVNALGDGVATLPKESTVESGKLVSGKTPKRIYREQVID